MKRIILLFCFIASMQTLFAQNKYADSLQTALAYTTKPVERFNLITKILENQSFFRGGNIDSADCVRLLQIAQQLKNRSEEHTSELQSR